MARRSKSKKILKDIVLLAREKLGLEQQMEGVYSLAAIKHLIESVIRKTTNNQEEI
jgi:hypothetical protein